MVNYIQGDLFTHKPNDAKSTAILAHACNCRGFWGAGVAAIFRKKFPLAYEEYHEYCQENSGDVLGTCQLIECSEQDCRNYVGPLYIACLFTAPSTGGRQKKSDIVANTESSLLDLYKQLEGQSGFEMEDGKFVISMPMINAGIFAVPWEQTEAVLKRLEDKFHFNVYVI